MGASERDCNLGKEAETFSRAGGEAHLAFVFHYYFVIMCITWELVERGGWKRDEWRDGRCCEGEMYGVWDVMCRYLY
jgi:hypothetical protein